MTRTLIVGYGNPIRGDDALGWRAAERLRELVTDADVEILTLHQLAPELMEPLSQVDLAVFIDAAVGPEPGAVLERRIEPRPSGSAVGKPRAARPARPASVRRKDVSSHWRVRRPWVRATPTWPARWS